MSDIEISIYSVSQSESYGASPSATSIACDLLRMFPTGKTTRQRWYLHSHRWAVSRLVITEPQHGHLSGGSSSIWITLSHGIKTGSAGSGVKVRILHSVHDTNICLI